ncbi:LPXTG cell wall anchor domain-containing protein [Nocardioides sp. dk4132]|uniref:thioester domain-containing protein n=1 Tax=unclassified Nocardioides TaxID=2615069 RepID=UPI001294E1A7|nr:MULTISPECIES: thioester domain-containing protein [unclassified Nocardioides]MQW75430.1 LPXTG cell wall anchor domain-containing protein [Nocardioides sp. dk4132]QGA08353.1 LPXTG cell wall anchor domain-containing protein [Nocardioides sp. dk884]
MHPTLLRRLAVVLTTLLLGATTFLVPSPAGATPAGGQVRSLGSIFTELQTVSITGQPGLRNVDSFVAPSSFDPLTGYPETTPEGSTPHQDSYLGLILAKDGHGENALTYCIDMFTGTGAGINYKRGDWSEANVPNIGYLGYILENYFPTAPRPAGVSDDLKAAATQAAIWYFTDRMVLDPAAEPELHALTSAIVADALANGPATEPAAPNLSISPDTAEAPVTGELVGPFTVTADGPATLLVDGVEVFSDAAGTQQLVDGDTVQAGAQLWVRTVSRDTPQGFALQRQVRVPESTVYLYDGSTPGWSDAQKLILAQEKTLEAVASVRITPYAEGGIDVIKTIGGTGAGLQDRVVVEVTCTPQGGGDPVVRTATIPAGTGAGRQTLSFTGLPAGAQCTITETENGDNALVNLTASSLEPDTVTIAEGAIVEVVATNEYERAYGQLQVTKRITGPAAGAQGEVVIAVDCDDPEDAFDREYTIPAGAPAGSHPQAVVTDIPAGTVCTVTETANGATDTVIAGPVRIEPATATITDGETAAVTVTNTYREREAGPEPTPTPDPEPTPDPGQDQDPDQGQRDDQDQDEARVEEDDEAVVASGDLPHTGGQGALVALRLGLALLLSGAGLLALRRLPGLRTPRS